MDSKKPKRTSSGTPGSFWYTLLYRLSRPYLFLKAPCRLETDGHPLPDGPAVYLSNHPSSFDYFHTAVLIWPRRAVPIANEYYLRKGLLKKLLTEIGVIPKKLFVDEASVILKARRLVKSGHSVYLAPEGRLSVAGEMYPIISSTGAFVRFLSVPAVLLRAENAFYGKPKWRPFSLRRRSVLRIRDVLSPEELKAMSPEEINRRIRDALGPDEASRAEEEKQIWRSRRKAAGLPNLIYRCPACGTLYSLQASGNRLLCSACSLQLRFDRYYRLEENPHGWRELADLYHALEETERKEDPSLSCRVTVRRFRQEAEDAGEGTAALSREGFSFDGSVAGEPLSFRITPEALKALPFSCGEEFETYYQNELYYFYPIENRQQCARWALLADLICAEYL